MNTPKEIVPHEPKYQPKAWEQYSLQELGMWVHLFVKRAGHRSDKDKARKDLEDASNYLAMMQEHVATKKQELSA